MILSFADKDTELVFREQKPKKLKLPVNLLSKALDKLRMLDAAEAIVDLYVPPSNHLEALRGDRKGYYSIRISNRWRICFCFAHGNADDVEIVDYH